MKHSNRALSLLLSVLLLLGTLPVHVLAAPAALTATAEAANIQKYGNVVLSLRCDELKAAGYAYGDVLTVAFLEQTMELPLCSNFSDVDSGLPAVFARAGNEYVLLAINMGDFATTYGIAVKTTHEDKTFEWHYADGVSGPVTFTLSLKEAGGYYDEYVMHQLSYTDERADYPALTDEQFANFRAVSTTGMGERVLYRTSSPVNPEKNRNAYADLALRRAGVTVVMNLADDPETVKSYEGYAESYYAATKHIALNMGVDFAAGEFQAKLAEGLRFFAANPGVYAVHCTEGKDRAGFVAALLEAFMGAKYDEIVADYMTTYYNYYGVTADDARYATIASSNIVKTLGAAFGAGDLASADLAALAEKYMKEIGLTDAELAALRKNLSARPALDLDALAANARDTDFFTPVYHTGLNYDELAYERVDPAPLLVEAEALRALMADAANLETFRTRFLALAERYDLQVAMACLLSNLQSADSKNAWAAEEYEKVSTETVATEDALRALVRDALASPCAAAFDGLLSDKAREQALRYRDKSPEEIELLGQDTALQSEYMSRIVDEYAVTVDGVKYTLDNIYGAYLNGDLTYEEYWPIYVELSKMANAAVGPIFVRMVDVRNRIAKAAGCDTYAEYAYKTIYSRDYTVADAQAFCDAVKEYIIPKVNAYNLLTEPVDESRLPGDVAYAGEGMFETLLPYFAQLSDELLESACYTWEHKAYDVDPAPNKTGTAYSLLIPYYNIPFYYANASGGWNDLGDAIHELGHNNAFYWNEENNWNDPSMVVDTAEVHSQGLELLMLRFYPELFGDQADEARSHVLYGMLSSIVNGCMYDEFQRRVYETPDLTLETVNRIFRQIAGEYGLVPADDPRTEMYGWYGVPHNFTGPMYYISYATSAAGALAFWEQSQEDWFAAVDDYLRFVAVGFENGFAGTFAAVGMESPMTESYLRELAQTVHDKLLPVAPYTDVYADDWYGVNVIFVNAYALMNGVGDGRFAPNEGATREQSMTILARMDDTREDAAPYTLDDGVAWAVENGVSDGEDRGAALTREQFVTMLYRYAFSEGPDAGAGADLSAYADAAEVSGWAADAMRWAVGLGIVKGTDEGLLVPGALLTRAQMAAMLSRFYYLASA